MSADVDAPESTPARKEKKHKDRSEKKESKKRKRAEEEKQSEHAAAEPADSTPSKTKKRKRSKVTADTVPPNDDNSTDIKSQPQYHEPAFNAAPTSPERTNSSLSIALDHNAQDPPNSPFFVQPTAFYLPLSPIAQFKALEGLCAEHFSPLLLTFVPSFQGILLSYTNPRFQDPQIPRNKDGSVKRKYRPKTNPNSTDAGDMSNSSNIQRGPADDQVQIQSAPAAPLSRAISEYGPTYIWLAADFLILKPQRDMWIEGHVNVQSPSQLGLVCWNLVNAIVESKNLPKDWKWVSGGESEQPHTGKARIKPNPRHSHNDDGHFIDTNGNRVEGSIRFRVLEIESLQAFGRDRNFMSIEGSLLPKSEESVP